MIPKLLDPDNPITATERVLGLIGTGAIRRDQLLCLLSGCLKHARVDQILQELRQKGWLSMAYTPGKGEAIYLLSRKGLRNISEDDAKTARQRIAYHLLVNDVLIRSIQRFGISGWEWFSRPDGSDKYNIIPSALVRVGAEKWYIDVDDGLQLSRQLFDKCHSYSRLLSQSGQLERVLFVATTKERVQYVRNKVTGLSIEGVRFLVCGIERVADVLEDAAVTIG